MDLLFTKINLRCFLGIHKWDTTSDPRCYRCEKFRQKVDPSPNPVLNRELRNGLARKIHDRRDLGILDPEHND